MSHRGTEVDHVGTTFSRMKRETCVEVETDLLGGGEKNHTSQLFDVETMINNINLDLGGLVLLQCSNRVAQGPTMALVHDGIILLSYI